MRLMWRFMLNIKINNEITRKVKTILESGPGFTNCSSSSRGTGTGDTELNLAKNENTLSPANL